MFTRIRVHRDSTEHMDVIKELLSIMQNQGMNEQSQDFLEVLYYIAGMQIQLGAMVEELQGVREQLAQMQRSQPKAVSEQLTDKVSHLQEKVSSLSERLSALKDYLIDTASQAVKAFKEKGKEEMSKVLLKGISGVKSMLEGYREKMVDILTDYEKTANQIESIGDELKQIGNSIGNVGRLIAGKGTKEVSEEQPGVGLTRAINAPIKKAIASMRKQIDSVTELIDKLPDIEVRGSLEKWQASILATQIDQLSYDYDTYQYRDTVEDREAQVANIMEDIRNGNTGYLNDFLNAVIAEGVRDGITDIFGKGTPPDDSEAVQTVRKAQELLDKLSANKPLAKVEELEENNYNMIDNVLNNDASKKEEQPAPGRISVKEKLAEKKAIIEQRDKDSKSVPEKDTEKKNQREI